jgi:hypothetical protein
MSIKARIEKLEVQQPSKSLQCVILTDNVFGAGTDEEQLERFRARNPGIDNFEIVRIKLVPLSAEEQHGEPEQ